MRLFNTLSGKIEDFKPIEEKNVRMYNCGPTVYNYAHIGNLRAFIFADTVRRTFEYFGYSVEQVINITDVGHLTSDADSGEDKVEKEAKKEHKTAQEITDFYTKAFFEDIEKLNLNTASTKFPKASEHIQEQINLIEKLVEKDVTYTTSDGIYFDTSKFKDYGKLGKINLAGLEEGARIGVNAEKKNITDFALWKFSKPEEKRQQEWDSPWSKGFPGWHLECSAMAIKYLGETFDIHTGGIDHIPVHHNNEIAQSECATGKPFSNYWLHNAHLNVESGKMAKSEGNFIRLKTLEDEGVHPIAYRYWLLTAHYQSPITFSLEAAKAAQAGLEDLIIKISSLKDLDLESSPEKYRKEIDEALSQNFNTPQAIAAIHKALSDKNADKKTVEIVMKVLDQVLGLKPEELSKLVSRIPQEIIKKQNTRDELRKAGEFEKADLIRKEIEKQGYIVKDMKDGSVVTRPLSSLTD